MPPLLLMILSLLLLQQVNGNLRVLDLSWNGLGYLGAVALAASLKENESLQELDISQNGINWQGALILSRALVNNSTLKTLRVGSGILCGGREETD